MNMLRCGKSGRLQGFLFRSQSSISRGRAGSCRAVTRSRWIGRVFPVRLAVNSAKMTTDFMDGTDRIRLPVFFPPSVSAVKSVLQLSGFEIYLRHAQSRPVTVINGKAASAKVIKKSEKCEKSGKSVLTLFHLESAVDQFVPNKIGGCVFSDFPKNFRGYMWGV